MQLYLNLCSLTNDLCCQDFIDLTSPLLNDIHHPLMAIFMTSTPWLLLISIVPVCNRPSSMDSLRCYSPHTILIPKIPKTIRCRNLIRASMDSSFSGSESKKAPNSVSFINKVNKVPVLASLCECLKRILLCANSETSYHCFSGL
jgi:hypothetical protein